MKFIVVLAVAAFMIFIAYGNRGDKSYPNEEFLANFSFYTCFQYAGDKEGLSKLFEKRKISKLSEGRASYFLDGKKGDVWSITSLEGQYSVAYRDDNLCTVFVKRTNVTEYINEVNDNIDRLSKKMDWKFNPEKFPDFSGENNLKTFVLIGVNETSAKKIKIVMGATYSVTGNYQVAFSTNIN